MKLILAALLLAFGLGAQTVCTNPNGCSSIVSPNFSTWTPAVTASGSMTVSGVTITTAQYTQVGPLIFFQVSASFTLGGTAATDVYISLPVAPVGADYTPVSASGSPNDAKTQELLIAFTDWSGGSAPTAITVRMNPFASWPAGATSVRVAGVYRAY